MLGEDRAITFVEYGRGLYRYPKRMIGREIPTLAPHPDVIVFAAHPDDDVLGLSATINRHQRKGEKVAVVYVTNGSGDLGESYRLTSKHAKTRSALRYGEARQALSLIGIPKESVYCLGFPDGGTHRYLKNMATDIISLVQKLNPDKIYVHSVEGGHNDHDMVSLAVKSACKKIAFSNLYEWAEYHPTQVLGTEDVKFLECYGSEIKVELTEQEVLLKKKMLALHKSQDVEQFYLMGEAIRPINLSHLEKELHLYSNFPKQKLKSIIDLFNESMSDKAINRVYSSKQGTTKLDGF